MSNNLFSCPVCGYASLDKKPWREIKKDPSFDICPCCRIQFGHQDYPLEDDVTVAELHRIWRRKWIASGMKFWHASELPANWNAIEQLKAAGLEHELNETDQTDKPAN